MSIYMCIQRKRAREKLSRTLMNDLVLGIQKVRNCLNHSCVSVTLIPSNYELVEPSEPHCF